MRSLKSELAKLKPSIARMSTETHAPSRHIPISENAVAGNILHILRPLLPQVTGYALAGHSARRAPATLAHAVAAPAAADAAAALAAAAEAVATINNRSRYLIICRFKVLYAS